MHASAGRSIRFFAFLLALFFIFTRSGAAQAPDLLSALGSPPNVMLWPVPGGFINLDNGNLHLEIPLQTVSERKGSSTSKLMYDSSFWYGKVTYVGATQAQYLYATPIPAWKLVADHSPTNGSINIVQTENTCQPTFQTTVGYTTFSPFQYIDDSGTAHTFNITTIRSGDGHSCGDNPNGGTATADGYTMTVTNYTNATVYDIHGDKVYQSISNAPYAEYEDTNGNIETASTDQLGRSRLLKSVTPTGTITLSNGYTIYETQIPVHSAFYPSQPIQTNYDYNGPITVISSIICPDGRQYSFTYDEGTDPGHYGTLTSMTLPTGATLRFGTTVVGDTSPGAYYSITNSWSTPDGSWTYSFSNNTNTITGPADPITHVQPQSTYSLLIDGKSGFYYCPTSTICKRTLTNYSGSVGSQILKQISITTNQDNQTANVSVTIDGLPATQTVYTYYKPSLPLISDRKDLDSSGNILRESVVNYYSNPVYTNRYIYDLVQSVKLYGPGGSAGNSSPLAETDYIYDGTPISGYSGFKQNPVGGLSTHDDSNYGTNQAIRGNVTSVSQKVGNGSIITTQTFYYNMLGDLIQVIDGKGNATKFDFSDNFAANSGCISGLTFAYPTTVLNALNQQTVRSYNGCDGSLHSTQDQNDLNAGRSGTVYSYDSMQRPTGTVYSDGGQQTVDYGGSTVPEVITTTTLAAPDPSLVDTQTLDAMGRVIHEVYPGGGDVDTTFDSFGRVSTVKNPHIPGQPASSDGTTTFSYDALGRKTIQSQPDGSKLQWCYDNVASSGQTNCSSNKSSFQANTTWVDYSDETGRHRQLVSDSLGRLISVMEPDGTSNITANPTVETDYQYDALGNLTGINQQGLTRSFTYDGLSRLLTATNPETGVTCYGTWSGGSVYNGSCVNGYDANSNLIAKTDARGITTSYKYDALNRMTEQDSSDPGTPTYYWKYDLASINGINITNPIGHLVASGTAFNYGTPSQQSLAGTVNWKFDPMGRILNQYVCTPSTCPANNPYQLAYTYDVAGNQTSYTPLAQPDVTFTLGYDAGGRLNSVKSNYKAPIIWTAQKYTAVGLQQATFGNGLVETYSYDNRLRMQSESLTNSNQQAIYSTALSYYWNGLVQTDNDSVNGNWTYHFDNLGRLLTGAASSGPFNGWSFNWYYDSFGNRKRQLLTVNGTQQPGPIYSFTGNRINGFCYDAAGNLLDNGPCPQSGPHLYSYYGDGRLKSADSGQTTYIYDGAGNRVTILAPPTAFSLDFLYNTNGAEMGLISTGKSGVAPNWVHYNITGGGRQFALIEGSECGGGDCDSTITATG